MNFLLGASNFKSKFLAPKFTVSLFSFNLSLVSLAVYLLWVVVVIILYDLDFSVLAVYTLLSSFNIKLLAPPKLSVVSVPSSIL